MNKYKNFRRWGYIMILLGNTALPQEPPLENSELEAIGAIISEPELLEPKLPPLETETPPPFRAELEELRARLEKITAERDDAVSNLQRLRADVEVIHHAQITAQERATGLTIDLRAARGRITVLENNLQAAQEHEQEQNAVLNERETQRADAMEAARSCGENLVNSEHRVRNTEASISRLSQENSDQRKQLDSIHKQLAESENNLIHARAQINSQEIMINGVNQQLVQRDENIKTLQDRLQENNESLSITQKQLAESQNQLTQLQTQLHERDTALQEMKLQLFQREENIQNLQSQLRERENSLADTQQQLAESRNQLTQLQTQLHDRDTALQEMKLQLSQREENIQGLQLQLREHENSLANMQQQVKENEAIIVKLRTELSAVTQERDNIQTRLTTVEQEKVELQTTLTKAKQDWTELNATHQNLDERYQYLMTTLAPIDGGNMDIKTAQSRAIEINNNYRSLWKKHLRRVRDPGLMNQIIETRRNLFFAQYQVMRINGGGELYILRPNDSLSILARLAYGDGSRIAEIRKANSHLLDSNEPLLVGTTLVVP